MKIKRIEYEACINLGDYENEKIRVSAFLEDDDTVEQTVESLRQTVANSAMNKPWNTYQEVLTRGKQLAELEKKIVERTNEWNQIAEFLQATGIKADASPMPMFSKLLTSAEIDQEQHQVVEGELEDDF